MTLYRIDFTSPGKSFVVHAGTIPRLKEEVKLYSSQRKLLLHGRVLDVKYVYVDGAIHPEVHVSIDEYLTGRMS